MLHSAWVRSSASSPRTAKLRTHVTTGDANAQHEETDCGGAAGGHAHRLVLRLRGGAHSPGVWRLSLGHPPGAALAGSAESLRHVFGAVSAAGGAVRAALCASHAGNCRGNFLWTWFGTVGARLDAARLQPAANFPLLSFLGGRADGAMVAADRSRRIFSLAHACGNGQASDRLARFFHALLAPGSDRMRCGRGVEPGCPSSLALALVGASALLRALAPHSGFSGTARTAGAMAISRSRCVASITHRVHAAALVLRRFHALAHSPVAMGDRAHLGIQLDRGNLALVSPAHQLHRSRQGCRPVLLPADATGTSLPEKRA